jgi:predicted SAM-dependent methyltransferase
MLKLHIGCGEKYIPGFIHIDVKKFPHVDYVISADKLDMFNDNSVDLIYSCHLLEHFGRHQIEDVLKEWYRVLKLGGILRLAVPDFDAVVDIYQKNRNLEEVYGLLMGGQTHEFNFHHSVFNFDYLSKLLKKVGFKKVYRYNWKETIHKDYDDFSQAYIPHMDKEHGTLMSLNLEAIK